MRPICAVAMVQDSLRQNVVQFVLIRAKAFAYKNIVLRVKLPPNFLRLKKSMISSQVAHFSSLNHRLERLLWTHSKKDWLSLGRKYGSKATVIFAKHCVVWQKALQFGWTRLHFIVAALLWWPEKRSMPPSAGWRIYVLRDSSYNSPELLVFFNGMQTAVQ